MAKKRSQSTDALIVSPGPSPNQVIDADGNVMQVPDDWALLPPGDAGLTRRVKAAGPTWTVKERRGRRVFSKGVWANQAQIEAASEKLEQERSTEAYAKRRVRDAERREKKQQVYVEDFETAVIEFLNFAARYASLAKDLAQRVTTHATPVGSGTVARTQRIPIERRAESAVIAWMRHQTTAYDDMVIPRVKGKRREVRRMLAERSRKLLNQYRQGGDIDRDSCPLARALEDPTGDAETL
ncbi:DUF2293 domain-containing protein [Roseiconus lacunae]|uniref:DUF2293 domain-containing protein n=1 Tax=Roseiconus lacunae TaxID=2605694 RepID=UPI0011F387E9|nr:DUF2293 domain-containing protein [Roseiconus lacunae]MCD0459424.1 DUF2293 domain-containing protein [Roseiconus lacunae]